MLCGNPPVCVLPGRCRVSLVGYTDYRKLCQLGQPAGLPMNHIIILAPALPLEIPMSRHCENYKDPALI